LAALPARALAWRCSMAEVLAGAQFDYPDGEHVARASGMRRRCAELGEEEVVQPTTRRSRCRGTRARR